MDWQRLSFFFVANKPQRYIYCIQFWWGCFFLREINRFYRNSDIYETLQYRWRNRRILQNLLVLANVWLPDENYTGQRHCNDWFFSSLVQKYFYVCLSIIIGLPIYIFFVSIRGSLCWSSFQQKDGYSNVFEKILMISTYQLWSRSDICNLLTAITKSLKFDYS